MALYEYRCPDGHSTEVFHRMDEAPAVNCAACGARAERVISMPMIHTQYHFSTQVRQSRFPRHRPESPSAASPPAASPPASTESAG